MNCHMYLTEEQFYLFSLFSLIYQKGPHQSMLHTANPEDDVRASWWHADFWGFSWSVRTRQILATWAHTTTTCWDVSPWVGTGLVPGGEDGINESPELDKWHKSSTKLFYHVCPNTPSSFSCTSFPTKLLPGNNISFLFFFMETIEKLGWYNEQSFGLGHNEMQVIIVLSDEVLCGVFVQKRYTVRFSFSCSLPVVLFCFSFCCLLDLSADIPLEIFAQLEIPTS